VLNARGIVFNIVGPPSMTLGEVDRAARIIYENVDADANMIARARERGLDVALGDAQRGLPAGKFDAVLTNAALHWMPATATARASATPSPTSSVTTSKPSSAPGPFPRPRRSRTS